MFPKFLIRKMYEKESLQLTTEGGFSFIVRNNLANGNVIEVYHLDINDHEIPFKDITVKNDTQSMLATEISPETPIVLKKGVNTIFSCKYNEASSFKDQEVQISFKFKIQIRDSNMKIDFDFKDILR